MGYYRRFPAAIPHLGARSIVLLTLSPLTLAGSLDLHALATPPAFNLSQDQTLQLSFVDAPDGGPGVFKRRFACSKTPAEPILTERADGAGHAGEPNAPRRRRPGKGRRCCADIPPRRSWLKNPGGTRTPSRRAVNPDRLFERSPLAPARGASCDAAETAHSRGFPTVHLSMIPPGHGAISSPERADRRSGRGDSSPTPHRVKIPRLCSGHSRQPHGSTVIPASHRPPPSRPSATTFRACTRRNPRVSCTQTPTPHTPPREWRPSSEHHPPQSQAAQEVLRLAHSPRSIRSRLSRAGLDEPTAGMGDETLTKHEQSQCRSRRRPLGPAPASGRYPWPGENGTTSGREQAPRGGHPPPRPPTPAPAQRQEAARYRRPGDANA
jgi:hypothetical protein